MANDEAKFPQNPPLTQKLFFLGAQIFLRILTVATTLASALVMITNKQSIQYGRVFTIDARYDYSREFRFFVVANIIACASSVMSLLYLLLVGRRSSNPSQYFLLLFHDLILMSLVLAGCAAATAIGMLAKYGNSHTGWMAICDHFDKFCDKGTVSMALSYVSVISLLFLTLLSANSSRQTHV